MPENESLVEQFRRMSGQEVLNYLSNKTLSINAGHVQGLDVSTLTELPKVNPEDPTENKRYGFMLRDVFEISGDGKRVMFKDIDINDPENPFKKPLNLISNASKQLRTLATRLGALEAKVSNYWHRMDDEKKALEMSTMKELSDELTTVIEDTGVFIAALESVFSEQTSKLFFAEEKSELDQAFDAGQKIQSLAKNVLTTSEYLAFLPPSHNNPDKSSNGGE